MGKKRSMDDIKIIRKNFRNYLEEQVKKNKLSKINADTQWSDADYPRKHANELGINYWQSFKNINNLENLISILKDQFEKEGKNSTTIKGYEKALKNFMSFIEEHYNGVNNMFNTLSKQYYWVCQGHQKDDKKYILAPVDNIHHHKRVNELKIGDIIVNYFNQQVNAISIVAKSPEIIKKGNSDWYKVVLDYKKLDKPIPKSVIKNIMKTNNIKPFKYGPFDVNYDYNQGYLFDFSKELLDLILGKVSKDKTTELSYNKIQQPLNQILYGPPGTGKTYHTKEFVKNILSKNTVKKTKKIIKNVNANTPWWQAIALAMYKEDKNKKYKVIELENLITDYIKLKNNNSVRNKIWEQLQKHTDYISETVFAKDRNAPFLFDKTKESEWYLTPKGINFIEDQLINIIVKEQPNKEINKYFEFITFHQSYSYEEFVEGIKPSTKNGQIKYNIVNGIFKNMCIKANSDPNNNYVLVIDEINRGNISKIFGELITLIEEDKRILSNGANDIDDLDLEINDNSRNKNSIVTNLPYSQKPFGVPQNLYIIGTMNTSDRSIASIDIALRRRFKFVEMMPNSDLVADFECNFKEIFEKLNTKIKILLDRDHQIGHSYFIKTKYANANIETLKEIWFSEIIPLLNEYFYCDWDKLKLIIPGFIKEIEIPQNLKNECEEIIYEFKTSDEVENFLVALNQEKFE